ncbi:MAG TPA: Rieske 2Fe-2S domain-containing protein, partial [Anaerolineae bacterium]|nr:Rieske 2Fe-2S domain-containing protein [Anaerolineae bacterium]
EEVSRRRILRVSLGLAGVLGVGALAKFLGYRPAPLNPTRFTLKAPQEYQAGSATTLPEAKAWLFRDDRGLYAISVVCTHLGCVVNHTSDHFECPCHGSQYNAAGYVIKGPAKLPLNYLELTLSPEGIVVLDTKVFVPSMQRLSVGG